MKYTRILKQITNFEEASLSPEVRRLLEQDSEFRAEFEQLKTVQQLLSLKTFEKPDAETETRIMRGIQRGMKSPDPELLKEDLPDQGRAFSIFGAVRFGAMAACAAMICGLMSVGTTMPQIGLLDWETPYTESSEEMIAGTPLEGINLATNSSATTLQFGTPSATSVPVNLDVPFKP